MRNYKKKDIRYADATYFSLPMNIIGSFASVISGFLLSKKVGIGISI